MADTDLIFSQEPLSQPADLVFGDDGGAAGDYSVSVSISLPGPTVAVRVAHVYRASIAIGLPGPTVAVRANYASNAQRPVVGKTASLWQSTDRIEDGIEPTFQSGIRQQSPTREQWQTADKLHAASTSQFESGVSLTRFGERSIWQNADRLQAARVVGRYADALRDRRARVTSRYELALDMRHVVGGGWEERLRDRRPRYLGRWQDAMRLDRNYTSLAGSALPLDKPVTGRWQDAMVVPPGVRPIIVPPEPEPCYLPDPHLVFSGAAAIDGHLVFICERHGPGPEPGATVVVPVRSVYMIINDVTLRRVDGDISLPALSLSLSLDADSWTWGFDASLPGQSLDYVLPSGGDPVELEASVNGTLFRLLAENVASERTFGQSRVRVSGRGKSALLAAPYSPTFNFYGDSLRTAQQLMGDVLTFNGVPIGWDIDWQITDWLVPAGNFAVQGTYIDGLVAIANAAGAYLQPHATEQEMSVLARYPVAPWDWGDVTPDYELPAAVAVREGIEFVKRPVYNRVYVSGTTSDGVLGRVTRSGTAGDLVAQMITDPLITNADAARQRGISVLADTGSQQLVTVQMPVVPESGIIVPGKFVSYVDGDTTRMGITRSVSISFDRPRLRQSILVETHV